MPFAEVLLIYFAIQGCSLAYEFVCSYLYLQNECFRVLLSVPPTLCPCVSLCTKY